jgi:hypothetical protein
MAWTSCFKKTALSAFRRNIQPVSHSVTVAKNFTNLFYMAIPTARM